MFDGIRVERTASATRQQTAAPPSAASSTAGQHLAELPRALAPSADRIENSFDRLTDRASTIATLMHASSSRNPTMVSNASIVLSRLLVRLCRA